MLLTSHTHTHTLSLSLTHTHSLSFSLSLSHTHTHSLSLCLSLSLSLSVSLSLSLLYRAHSASHILSFSHISCADKENKQRNRECDRGEIGHDHVTMRSQIIAVTMSQHKDTVTSRWGTKSSQWQWAINTRTRSRHDEVTSHYCDNEPTLGHDHVTIKSQVISVTMSQNKDTITSRRGPKSSQWQWAINTRTRSHHNNSLPVQRVPQRNNRGVDVSSLFSNWRLYSRIHSALFIPLREIAVSTRTQKAHKNNCKQTKQRTNK